MSTTESPQTPLPVPRAAQRSEEEIAARVKALESILIEQGVMTTDAVDRLAEIYENEVGPQHGARVVAKAWTDPAYRERLLADATTACQELGIGGLQGEHMLAVENTDTVHNAIVCTLCSCYPRVLLGIPPDWYKSRNYRSRMVREPRMVLREFGLGIAENVQIRVHDSTADMRYLVLPMRPQGTEGWDEARLAAIVTRDSMIGVAVPQVR
jgi:nitrile hydratase subunit alpha